MMGRRSRAVGPARRERSRGQALAEFALIAPLLFLVILGTIEAGRFIFFYELMNNAAREGARYGIVHGADAVCSSGPMSGESFTDPIGSSSCDFPGQNIIDRVEDAAAGTVALGEMVVYPPVWTDKGNPTPNPGEPNNGSNDRGNHVTVFVDFSYRPLIGEVFDTGFIPEITISAESTLVINY